MNYFHSKLGARLYIHTATEKHLWKEYFSQGENVSDDVNRIEHILTQKPLIFVTAEDGKTLKWIATATVTKVAYEEI